MTLATALTPIAKANTGRCKFIAGDPIGGGSLSGILEPKPGWLLCNGAVILSSGRYQALYTMLAGRFGGAGKLPTIIDGVTPIPRGTTSFTISGAAGGEILHALISAEYPSHYHVGQNNNASGPGNGLLNVDGFANRSQYDAYKNTAAYGGGTGHQNMPPYQVGGFWLVKL
jgi:microcystin-dependent protein